MSENKIALYQTKGKRVIREIDKTRSRRDFINQTMGGIAFLGATGSGVLTRDIHQNITGKQAEAFTLHVRSYKGLLSGSH